MKNKKIKMISFFILVFFVLNLTSSVYAKLADSARSESPNAPSKSTTTDVPTTSVPSNKSETTSNTTTYYIPYYNAVEGNVYEDLGEAINENGIETTPIEGVTVYLKQDDNIISSTQTDSEGNYSFTNLSPGTYTTEFIYGKYDESDANNIELVKEILKYNGQDYIVTQAPSANETTRIDIEQTEITYSGTAATQIYLAIDCSPSAYNEISSKTGERRIDIEVSATKELVNELLNCSESIYIGIIFFDSDSTRAVSLTRDEEKINEALDTCLDKDVVPAFTDIVSALDKAYDSFANNDKDNSNRIIVLVSDCMPTKYSSTCVYGDDSDEEADNKVYNIIGPATSQKIEELREDGIKVMSLTIESDDEETKEFVESIFNENSLDFYKSVDGINEIVNAISTILKDEIITSVKTSTQSYSNTWVTQGKEDQDRREEVDNNFKTFNYETVKLFDVINDYDGSEEQQDKAKKLSELTYMTVTGGTYKMTPGGENYCTYDRDEDGNITHTYEYIYSACSFSGQDLYLGLRTTPDINITSTITGVRIILQNGTVKSEFTQNIESEIPIIGSLEDDISYGASIEFTYQVQITNKSTITYNYVELLNYLPEGLSYTNKTDVSLEETNATNYVYLTDEEFEELYNNGYISENTYNEMKDRKILKIQFGDSDTTDFQLCQQDTIDFSVTASILIASLNDLEDVDLTNNVTEVLEYSNNESKTRRMAIKATSSNMVTLTSVYPGDLQDYDSTTVTTNYASLIPPTGDDKRQLYILVIPILLVIALIVLKKRRKQN